MLYKTKIKVVFWTSLIAGVALCIGGIWVAALLVPGGIFIAGALGMYQSAYSPDHVEESRDMVELTQVDNPISRPHENGRPIVIEQNIGLFFMYPNETTEALETIYPERPRNPSPRSRLTIT